MQITQDILEKINHYDTIILHRHTNPDPDAIGSQVGLKEIIQTNFPDKRVLATGYNEPPERNHPDQLPRQKSPSYRL